MRPILSMVALIGLTHLAYAQDVPKTDRTRGLWNSHWKVRRYDVTWHNQVANTANIHWTVSSQMPDITFTFTAQANHGPEAVAEAMFNAWNQQANSPTIKVTRAGATVSFVVPGDVELKMHVREGDAAQPPCSFPENICDFKISQISATVTQYTTIGVQWELEAGDEEEDVQWTVAYVTGGITYTPSVEFEINGGSAPVDQASALIKQWLAHRENTVNVCRNGAYLSFSAPGDIIGITVDGEESGPCTLDSLGDACVLSKSLAQVSAHTGECISRHEPAFVEPPLPPRYPRP